ncbi:hypothetical protein [Streptomyces sp. SCSIO ZS0520]|uniref:hypothetical protein n=1 Tax=Streptomyces sp. SCSIO ZS0520 TaxID=2892996 RepID=UPI0021D9D100|nr:hypothetical protein [Streptomyces sp. SCSIO ZS0520]
MRPQRFEKFLRSLLEQDGNVKEVQTAAESGHTKHPYGLAVTYRTGARVLLVWMATAAPGDNYEGEEAIVEGDPSPPPAPMPDDLLDGGKVKLAAVDKHMAALILGAGNQEIAAADIYSTREKRGAIPYGVTLDFHDTSRLYLYVIHALPQGRDGWPNGGEYEVPAAV